MGIDAMILSFRHKGLKAFFKKGTKAGIQPHHEARLLRQLARLDEAKAPEDMNVASWDMHRLVGDRAGFCSVSVNANWRLVFSFVGEDVVGVDYIDYH